jgi:hypothetical protein
MAAELTLHLVHGEMALSNEPLELGCEIFYGDGSRTYASCMKYFLCPQLRGSSAKF